MRLSIHFASGSVVIISPQLLKFFLFNSQVILKLHQYKFPFFKNVNKAYSVWIILFNSCGGSRMPKKRSKREEIKIKEK